MAENSGKQAGTTPTGPRNERGEQVTTPAHKPTAPPAPLAPPAAAGKGGATPSTRAPQGMIPARARRRTKLERGSMRVLATGGIIGLAVILGAVLVAQDVEGWIVGLVVGLASVILAAILWSSREL